jgi:fructose-1,6-bisphosphatase/inositol monophosphatase family enzyme
MRDRLRPAAYRPRRLRTGAERIGRRCRTRSAASAAASLDLAFIVADRLDGYWEHNLPPRNILVQEASGMLSGMEGSDDPLKTGHVICGNEFTHGNW